MYHCHPPPHFPGHTHLFTKRLLLSELVKEVTDLRVLSCSFRAKEMTNCVKPTLWRQGDKRHDLLRPKHCVLQIQEEIKHPSGGENYWKVPGCKLLRRNSLRYSILQHCPVALTINVSCESVSINGATHCKVRSINVIKKGHTLWRFEEREAVQ